jgi:WD40 repeat protein
MDWQRVGELLAAARALPETERCSFLDRSCAGDPGLRAEVESLLQHVAEDSELLEAVQNAATDLLKDEAPPAGSEGTRIGPYRLIRPLGSGGMATVWLAVRDDDEYRKEVAIKLMHVEGSPALHARFLSERQILATLDHANIARLLDGGTTDTGVPYVVMEHVEGQPIDTFCSERGLGIRERIELFRSVCAAVQYAHRNLVVHRDIKPGNILVTPDGMPKLLDFGIAKLLGPEATASLTSTSERVLTPRYASPEQIRGEAISTASDVYSMGVLLYELFTGVSPYSREHTDPIQLANAICRVDPAMTSIIAAGGEDWRRQLRGDLDNIVAKALRKEPQRRYPSVEELSEDLHRHLIRVPVRARPATIRYRLGRFVSRNRFAVAAALLALLGLVLATVLSLVQMQRAVTAQALAERERSIAVGEAARARLTAALAALQAGLPVEARRLLETAPEAQREWEWFHLYSLVDRAAAAVEAPGTVAAGFETARDELITISGSGTVRWWNPFLPSESRRIELGVGGIHTAGFSRDGSHLAAAAGGELFYWSLSSVSPRPGGPPLPLWRASLPEPLLLSVSNDGKWLAAATAEEVILWGNGEVERRWRHGFTPLSLSISADGSRILLVAKEGDGSYRLYDARGHLLNTAFGRDIAVAALSPDGRIVAGLENDSWLRLRDGPSSRVTKRFAGHSAALTAGAFLPGGKGFVTGSADETLRLWDLSHANPSRLLSGHASAIQYVNVSDDGRWILSRDDSSLIRLWSTSGEAHDGPLPGSWTAFSDDDSWLLTASVDGRLRFYDRASREAFDLRQTEPVTTTAMALSSDDRYIVTGHRGGSVLHDLQREQTTSVAGEEGVDVVAVAFDSESRTGFAASASGVLLALDVTTGGERFRARIPSPRSLAAAPSKYFAVAHAAGVEVLDITTGERLRTISRAGATPWSVSFTADGHHLASGWSDGNVTLVDPGTGTTVDILSAHTSEVLALSVSRDGRRLASGSRDSTVAIWDLAQRRLLLQIRTDAGSIVSLNYSADGTALAVGGDETHIWDTTTARERWTRFERLRIASGQVDEPVAELFLQTGIPELVAIQLRSEDSLSEIQRRAALRRTLSPPIPAMPPRAGSGVDKALVFPGGDAHVLVGESESLRMTGAFTIEAWIRPSRPAGEPGWRTVVNKEGEYQLAIDPDGHLVWNIAGPEGWQGWSSQRCAIPLERWTHVALVRESGNVRLFLNGRAVQVRSISPITGDHHPDMNELRIGGRQHTAAGFEGRIDEVRLWSAARTGDQILGDMSRRPAGDAPGLLASWSFEGTGPRAAEATGRHPGRLVGARRETSPIP